MDPSTIRPPQSAAPYAAVIYFHGMGDQRHLEETSRLIDGLDQFLAASHRQGASLGYMTKIKPQLEPGRDSPDETFTFIRSFYRASAKDDWAEAKLVRFYEVYWAPVMAGQKSAIGVLRWIVRQVFRPLGTLRSPWRERQRLRRASLAALYEASFLKPLAGVETQDYSTLAQRYDDFESPTALQKYPGGTFDQFIDYLADRSSGRPETSKRHQTLARAWLARYRSTEARNAFLLVTMALALALLAGAALGLLLALLQHFASFVTGTPLAPLAAAVPATWKTALGLAGAVAGLLGLTHFLTDYLGDVEAWATYEETDEKHERRQKVIGIGAETLSQVLRDDRCQRAVLVSHSLGTSVAHDTLLSIVRNNRARNPQDPISGPTPLDKIEHFVTLGSPIDKIEYFFESYRSPFHRYRRVTEYLRGDIGTEPFCRNRKPFIHWINFWDDGDPVSGALHSPAGHEGFGQRVDNVHVANLAFPNPATSHAAYFRNPDVMSRLFEIVFKNGWSFQTLPPRQGQDRDWASVFQGPAIDAPGKRRVWTLLTLAIPWLALLSLLLQWLVPGWALPAWTATACATAVVLTGLLVLKGRGHGRLGRTPAMSDEVGASELAVGSTAADPTR